MDYKDLVLAISAAQQNEKMLPIIEHNNKRIERIADDLDALGIELWERKGTHEVIINGKKEYFDRLSEALLYIAVEKQNELKQD